MYICPFLCIKMYRKFTNIPKTATLVSIQLDTHTQQQQQAACATPNTSRALSRNSTIYLLFLSHRARHNANRSVVHLLPRKVDRKVVPLSQPTKKRRHTTTLNTRISSTREKPCCPTHSHTHSRKHRNHRRNAVRLQVPERDAGDSAGRIRTDAGIGNGDTGDRRSGADRVAAAATGQADRRTITVSAEGNHYFMSETRFPVRYLCAGARGGRMDGGGRGVQCFVEPFGRAREGCRRCQREWTHTTQTERTQTCAASGMSFIVLNCVAHFRHRICVYSVLVFGRDDGKFCTFRGCRVRKT